MGKMEITESEIEKFRFIFGGPATPVLLCFLGIPLLLHHILPSAAPSSPFISSPARSKPARNPQQNVGLSALLDLSQLWLHLQMCLSQD